MSRRHFTSVWTFYTFMMQLRRPSVPEGEWNPLVAIRHQDGFLEVGIPRTINVKDGITFLDGDTFTVEDISEVRWIG